MSTASVDLRLSYLAIAEHKSRVPFERSIHPRTPARDDCPRKFRYFVISPHAISVPNKILSSAAVNRAGYASHNLLVLHLL